MAWMYRGLGIVLVCVACQPSMAAMSAGQIGCSPNDITISEEGHEMGLNVSTETWVAECQGRRFICSKTNAGGGWLKSDDKSGWFSSQDTDVSCREELGSQPTTASAEPPPQRRDRERPQGPAPKGAAGFEFGSSEDQARSACESAGHSFQAGEDSRFLCNGAAQDLGFAATVTLGFCNARVCDITIERRPDANWVDQFRSLEGALTEKYGRAADSDATIPQECRKASQFVACMDEGRARKVVTWSWQGGERIELFLGKPAQAKTSGIYVSYRRPAAALNAKGTGL